MHRVGGGGFRNPGNPPPPPPDPALPLLLYQTYIHQNTEGSGFGQGIRVMVGAEQTPTLTQC